MSLYGKPSPINKLIEGSLKNQAPPLFNGPRDLALTAYQLYLIKQFKIERSEILEKFVIGDDVFDDLPSALAEADARYEHQLAAADARRIKKLAALAIEDTRVQAALAIEAMRVQTMKIEAKALKSQLEKNRKKTKEQIKRASPWVALGVFLLVCLVAWNDYIEDQRMQLVWSTPAPVVKDCPDCPAMVKMPTGSFEMGSGNSTSVEQPTHRVSVASFLIGRTEVTQGEWAAVMGDNLLPVGKCGDDCPMANVSWIDALNFVRKLSEKTGKQYRLPSEAEWEFAARAGSSTKWSFGETYKLIDSYGWYKSNSQGKVHPVAQKKANAVGLYDMHGNVWEWTQDCWNTNYSGAPSNGSAWTSGDCTLHVLRGGSWADDPIYLTSAYRISNFYANKGTGSNGFRVARMP